MTALHAKLMDGRVSKLQIKSALICCRGVIQKLRGQEEEGVSRDSTFRHATKGRYQVSMSTIVHSSGGGDQNWVKYGPCSC